MLHQSYQEMQAILGFNSSGRFKAPGPRSSNPERIDLPTFSRLIVHENQLCMSGQTDLSPPSYPATDSFNGLHPQTEFPAVKMPATNTFISDKRSERPSIESVCMTFTAIVGIGGCTSATATPATVLWASFETQEVQNWTIQRPNPYPVDANSSFFQGSNLDGVAGERFLLCGIGTNPGKIRFSISTVPGRSYALSYYYGGTDTQRLPIGSGPGFQLTFKSSVQAFHGRKTIIDHLGNPVEIDDLESLASQTHPISTPGVWNWRIHAWLPVGYPFVATSDTAWIEFETSTTNGMASVGVLDQVRVTTEPFAEISISEDNVRVDFAGRLQESGNLLNWSEVSPSPNSPFVFPKGHLPKFFRVAIE
jgi:hypothetical protein